MHLLAKELSLHQEITVYETEELYDEKGTFRVMEFSDNAIQGALDCNAPERIVFEYPRAMIHLMEFNNPAFEDVFIIGHGIGTIASHYPEKRFKIAELDEKVVELSRRYFGYNRDNVIVGDGRHILEGEESQAYDYVLLDAFTSRGTPRHLTSREFFKIARDKLESRGSIIMNLTGKSGGDNRINTIYTTLKKEYPYTKAFTLGANDINAIQNVILIGQNQPISFQGRHMAGFTELEPEQGPVMRDDDAGS